jgi:ubiquinone/menaquinone biosynthesis C-methylase UbiE
MNIDTEPLVVDLDAPSISLPEGLVFPPGKPPRVRKSILGASPHKIAFYGGRIPDFLGVDGRMASRILGWSDELLQSLLTGLKTSREKGCVPSDILPEMEANGLASSDGKLTRLGQGLGWHAAVGEERGNEREIGELVEKLEIGENARILDLGCGAGQALFSLQRSTGAEGVGIDCDLNALALGYRIQSNSREKDIHRICASGEAIPFKDCCFSHVISQVALNYMHQYRALREVARVLRPGGLMLLFVENFGYDLQCTCRSRSVMRMAKAGYCMVSGILATVAGIQISPGNAWAPTRAFISPYRLRKILRDFGCEVFSVKNKSMFMGLPVGTIVLARKSLAIC